MVDNGDNDSVDGNLAPLVNGLGAHEKSLCIGEPLPKFVLGVLTWVIFRAFWWWGGGGGGLAFATATTMVVFIVGFPYTELKASVGHH